MIFISTEEVKAMWQFIDPIIKAWQENMVLLKSYQPGTNPETPDYNQLPAGLKKEIAMIGLGKMGNNLTLQLREKGWQVLTFDREKSLSSFPTLKEVVNNLTPPKLVWLMLPSGKPTEEVIFGKEGLVNFLNKGDIVIDGGNSFYKDSVVRAKKLAKKGIIFIDVGVSGGPGGAAKGASLMVGGKKETYNHLLPLFNDLAQNQGVQFFEGFGAGHFVKMVHNGIEYGMMQAIAEGFAILKKSNYRLNLTRVADVYNHGSVIESRLINWLRNAFELHQEDLKNVSGKVGYTGEGEWTVKTAKELKVKAKIIEEALRFRVQSEKNPSYQGKILSSLRQQFGGHGIKK